MIWRVFFFVFAAIAAAMPATNPALAETERPSQCFAIAKSFSAVVPATYVEVAMEAHEVEIAFVTHSTYRLTSAGGVTIATDFSGYAGSGKLPDVVTMNHAHTTHYTDVPDPAIKHVLRGWNPEGGPAKHRLTVGEFLIRNVPTDIRTFAGGFEKDGNSIFVFEIGGLCIGHLGHLHHRLTASHFGKIGRLDIVMVVVDGGYTLALSSVLELLQKVRASIVLPMHAFGPSTLNRFLGEIGKTYQIEYVKSDRFTVSLNSLPERPVVKVLQGLTYPGYLDE